MDNHQHDHQHGEHQHPAKPEPTKKLVERDSKYWRSVEEIDVKFQELEPEFASSPLRDGAAEEGDDTSTDSGRREFLKLMAASAVMFGASACTRRPVEKIIPYVNKSEEITPGVANWYASSCMECSTACGVLVKTREGRPIKLEGNPEHPLSRGGLCARGQASVLNLYDADRLQTSLDSARKGGATALTSDQLDGRVVAKLKEIKAKNGRVVVLTGEMSSPSTKKLIQEFVGGFGSGSSHQFFEPINMEEIALASDASYGTRAIPRYRFDAADMVVSFGADFLGTWHSMVEYTKAFTKRRKVGKESGNSEMSKLVVFETMMTLTGSNSDQRFRVKSGEEIKAALAIAAELIINQSKTKYAGDAQVANVLRPYANAKLSEVSSQEIKAVANELWNKRGKGIVLGGGYTVKGEAGVALEIVVNLLNSALENEGVTVEGSVHASQENSSTEKLKALIADMSAGKVDAVIIHKANPVYAAPKGLNFKEALAKVPFVANFNTANDETAQVSDVTIATHHSFENWGDASPQNGVYSISQPTIAPMYATLGFEDALIGWAKKVGNLGKIASSQNWHEYLKSEWQGIQRSGPSSAPFMLFWENTLRSGVYDAVGAAKGASGRARSFNKAALAQVASGVKEMSGMSLVMYPKMGIGDGRSANNPWLQELPDPISKMTWDNYAQVSVSYAKKNGITDGDVVRVKAGDQIVELPAQVQPGVHDDTVAIAMGYGRTAAGKIGSDVGVNVFPMAIVNGKTIQTTMIPVTLEKTGRTVKMATTQKHHSLENRPIVKEATFTEFKRAPSAGNEAHMHLKSLWPKHDYPGYRWAMAIDLNSCTGCGACVIGCQSENNIPVVGKKNVVASREMHWLRIDRYYSGRADNPETVHQPMLCQHCENAPCETVCPVLATMHDHEGINQQVYNRCVGTRYCANNCPYKVRRFNWFTFTDVAKPMQYAYNPDVTVRTRGVMEKCTFCIQRVREGKDRAKDQGRAVVDEDIKTACQQSCPGDAITFGNINNKNSLVTKLATSPRGYHVLEDLNVRPSISYLTKIRNKEAT